jgi:hypothetical protein
MSDASRVDRLKTCRRLCSIHEVEPDRSLQFWNAYKHRSSATRTHDFAERRQYLYVVVTLSSQKQKMNAIRDNSEVKHTCYRMPLTTSCSSLTSEIGSTDIACEDVDKR